VRVAAATLAAWNLPRHPRRIEIREQLARGLIIDERTDGDFTTKVDPKGAVHLAATAMISTSRLQPRTTAQIDQGVSRPRRLEDHRTAAAPVTTIRSSPRHEFLASEGHTPVSTAARDNVDGDLIDETHESHG
jgi:GDP-D-mannose dehydratase